MVRERVNQEIEKQQKMATLNLPSLQPPGSVDGLEMFGLLSPAVIQVSLFLILSLTVTMFPMPICFRHDLFIFYFIFNDVLDQ